MIRSIRSPHQRALVLRRCVLLPIAALALTSCNRSPQQAPGQMPPPEVSAVTVQPRDIPITLEYVGRTEGVREVEVRPRVSGILQRWNYTEGSSVKAGQSLFTIDPAPFQAVVARATTAWNGAGSMVNKLWPALTLLPSV